MQFEVKGRSYFLAFVEEERRWYVFSATPQGLHRIPVYIDGFALDKVGVVEQGKPTISN